MDNKTQSGLLLLIIGFIITLMYSLIVSASYFFIEDYQTFILIGSFGIISFIGVISILIGGIFFLMGRKEFGEKHQKNVIKALMIFLINIVVVVILASVMVYIIISSMSYSSEINSTLFLFYIVIILVFGAILGSLMYYFALIELEDEKGKNFLYVGIISSICISIINSIYISGYMGGIFETISSINGNPSFTGFQNFGGIGFLSIIPSILFIFALYIPYSRIKKGELVPQVLSTYKPEYYPNVPVRYCPSCGRNIPMDAQFCSYCGRKF